MPRIVLLLDCNFLCYRAYHALGNLSNGGVGTGVLYGFFRDIEQFQEIYQTKDLVFCFDHGPLLREGILPGYKDRTSNKTKEELDDRIEVGRQARLLRDELLYDIGYRNIHHAKGYEADDFIAKNVNDITLASCFGGAEKADRMVIVSADHDLYQMLRPMATIWTPGANGKTITFESFKNQWGIHPEKWSIVKALAGCNSDKVPGVDGVGEATAVKYILGTLPPHHKTHKAINEAFNSGMVKRNLSLVKLPFDGTPRQQLQPDQVTTAKWNAIMAEFGAKSLIKGPRGHVVQRERHR